MTTQEQIEEIALRVAQDFISNLGTERAFIASGWIPVLMREFLAELAKVSEPVAYMLRNDVDGVDLSDEAFSWDKDTSTGHTIPVFTHSLPQPDLVAELQAEIKRLQLEVANRNKRALDGDKAVSVNEKLVDQIEQQQAHIDMLREALLLSRNSYVRLVKALDEHDQNDPEEQLIEVTTADKALAATPESSLREHDAKLVERIVDFILHKNYDNDPYILADKIMKGKY